MNLKDCREVLLMRLEQRDEEERNRERQIFLNKCLREIDGEDAYEFLLNKACKILGGDGTYISEPIYIVVNYYFDNKEHFDCSFVEWLYSDNGPIVRRGINGLFPEFEIITSNKYEIAKMAKEYYDVELKFDWEGDYVYSLEFNFREINSKRVDMGKVKNVVKKAIMKEVE